MSWAGLFERASDHETTTETIRTALAAARTEQGTQGRGTQERDARKHDGRESDE